MSNSAASSLNAAHTTLESVEITAADYSSPKTHLVRLPGARAPSGGRAGTGY